MAGDTHIGILAVRWNDTTPPGYGYTGYFNNRKTKHGGGIAIYVNNARVRHSSEVMLTDICLETTFIKCQLYSTV